MEGFGSHHGTYPVTSYNVYQTDSPNVTTKSWFLGTLNVKLYCKIKDFYTVW